jgi:hypothetical protein
VAAESGDLASIFCLAGFVLFALCISGRSWICQHEHTLIEKLGYLTLFLGESLKKRVGRSNGTVTVNLRKIRTIRRANWGVPQSFSICNSKKQRKSFSLDPLISKISFLLAGVLHIR